MPLTKRELQQMFGQEGVDVAIRNIDAELGPGFAETNLDLLEAYVEYLWKLEDSPSHFSRAFPGKA